MMEMGCAGNRAEESNKMRPTYWHAHKGLISLADIALLFRHCD